MEKKNIFTQDGIKMRTQRSLSLTSAPMTACERITQRAPRVVSPMMCTLGPSSQCGPMVALSDTIQKGPMLTPSPIVAPPPMRAVG
jgi:hypothetical protein